MRTMDRRKWEWDRKRKEEHKKLYDNTQAKDKSGSFVKTVAQQPSSQSSRDAQRADTQQPVGTSNTLAVVGFVLAILTLFLFWIPVVGVVLSLVVILFGIVGSLPQKPYRRLGYTVLLFGAILLVASTAITCFMIYAVRFHVYDYPVLPEPVCPEPYLLIETGCCLDTNSNRVCDEDEGIVSTVVTSEQSSEAPEIDDSVMQSLDDLIAQLEEGIVNESELDSASVVESEATPSSSGSSQSGALTQTSSSSQISSTDSLEEEFAEEIASLSSQFRDADFEYTELAAQPSEQYASLGDSLVYLARIENTYGASRPHYFKVFVRSESLDWVQNSDDKLEDYFVYGPYETTEPYIDVPIILTVGKQYGYFNEKTTAVGQKHTFALELYESSQEEMGYDSSNKKTLAVLIE